MESTNKIMERYEKLFDDTLQFGIYKEEFFKTALEISDEILKHHDEMSESYNVSYIHNKLFAYMDDYIKFNNL